jgi:hypothetical protein
LITIIASERTANLTGVKYVIDGALIAHDDLRNGMRSRRLEDRWEAPAALPSDICGHSAAAPAGLRSEGGQAWRLQ